MESELKNIIDQIENNRVKGIDYLMSNSNEKIVNILSKALNKAEISESEAEDLFLIEDVNDLIADLEQAIG